MFDFRYHALSLVAVFLALGIGIVLGSSLGDSVVSQANQDVRSSLRGDLVDARSAAAKANTEVSQRDKFINASFARIAASKLSGSHITVITDGPLQQSVESDVRSAVKGAGGSVDSVSQFDAQPDLPTIVGKLEGTANLPPAPAGDQLRALGRRLGRGLATGNGLARRLQNAFPDSFKGTYGHNDAVVYFRTDDVRNDQAKTFELALLEGVRSAKVPVVGVEQSDTNPTQIPFYVNAGLSSVDNVDLPAGQIALVLTLAGAEGNYGQKSTANAPLPPPSGSVAGTAGG